MGLVAGVLMVADGESAWSLLLAPPMFAVIGAATLGVVVGLIWMMSVGRVTYVVTPTHLLGYRGRWKREEVELARVESIEFDEDIEWTDLVFTGWLGYTSPIPALVVHLDGNVDRWDPSNSAVIFFPRILLCGERQRRALVDLEREIAAARADVGSTTVPPPPTRLIALERLGRRRFGRSNVAPEQ